MRERWSGHFGKLALGRLEADKAGHRNDKGFSQVYETLIYNIAAITCRAIIL